MFWINQFCKVFLVAFCDLDVNTFVFLVGQNPPYCRGGKLRFKARKFDMLLQMFGTLGALLCTFGPVLRLKLYFRWLQFSPLLGRVRKVAMPIRIEGERNWINSLHATEIHPEMWRENSVQGQFIMVRKEK